MTVNDVLGTELTDFVRDGRDDVATKLLALTEILALESEFVLLGHVCASTGSDLVHDVEKNGFGCAVALSSVLGRVTNVTAGDVHGAIG